MDYQAANDNFHINHSLREKSGIDMEKSTAAPTKFGVAPTSHRCVLAFKPLVTDNNVAGINSQRSMKSISEQSNIIVIVVVGCAGQPGVTD